MSRADKEILRGQTSLFLLSMSSVVWEMPNTSNLFAGKRARRRPKAEQREQKVSYGTLYYLPRLKQSDFSIYCLYISNTETKMWVSVLQC